jgi:hypothetical protein
VALISQIDKNAGKELACAHRDVYDAFKRSGQPCLSNPAFEPKQAPMTQPAVTVSRDPPGCGLRTMPNGQQSYICQ